MNKISAIYVSILALIVAVVALVMCINCCANKAGGNVEEVLTNNPELIVKAMQNYEQKQREEAQAQAQKMVMDNLDALNNNSADGIIANPNGKITLVEFFDFNCGYCHKIYPAIKAIGDKNPDVKVIAKSLTFVAPSSKYAAKAALAAKEQGKYAEVYHALFETNGALDEAKVDEVVASTGVDMEKYKADMNSAKIEQALNAMADLASKIQVNGVPTLVLNGKIVQTLDESVIQSEIDAARK